MIGDNLPGFQAKFGPSKPSDIPAPDMKTAGAMPKAMPAPAQSSGFARLAGGGPKPTMPSPMGGDSQ